MPRDRKLGFAKLGLAKLGLAGWLALAAMVLLFAGKLIVWLLPHNGYGIISEAALVLLAFAMAWIATRLIGRGPGFWALTAFCAYLAASSAWLGWAPREGLGFGVNKRYIFSAPGCEFAIDFDRPPEQSKLRRADAGYLPISHAAASVDVGAVTAYRAECTSIGETERPRNADEVRRLARATTRLWAEASGLQIAYEDFQPFAGDALYRLDGTLGGSVLPEGVDGKARRTVASVWTYIGRSSVMTVYVLQSVGEELSARSLAFLRGVYRR